MSGKIKKRKEPHPTIKSDSRDIFVGIMQKLIMLGMNKRKAPRRTTMMMPPDKKAAEGGQQ
jgi:hypothetical protein